MRPTVLHGWEMAQLVGQKCPYTKGTGGVGDTPDDSRVEMEQGD